MATVVITGCSSGFGLASALAFARHGDTVYATMRNPGKAEPLLGVAAKEGLDIRVKALDVTQPSSFSAVLQNIVDEAGAIDVLVNNAGVLRTGALEDLSEQAIRDVMETNFIGPMLLTRQVLPHMRRQLGGYIIMISSLSGIAGLAGDVTYTGSKFALEGATEALRHEVDRWGIKVALVEAGLYATGIFDPSLPKKGTTLPDAYPEDSPYRPLVERRLKEVFQNIGRAPDPEIVGQLLVKIANSDGRQLRWPADRGAEVVIDKVFGQSDLERDLFLREASGIDWWSEGKESADEAGDV